MCFFFVAEAWRILEAPSSNKPAPAAAVGSHLGNIWRKPCLERMTSHPMRTFGLRRNNRGKRMRTTMLSDFDEAEKVGYNHWIA